MVKIIVLIFIFAFVLLFADLKNELKDIKTEKFHTQSSILKLSKADAKKRREIPLK